jgi:hypothetical protein
MHIHVFACLGKYISSVRLKPGDFCNGQIDGKSFPGQAMEFVFPQSLFQRWQELTCPFIHPKDAIDQWAIMLVEWDKCLTLVRNANSLQLSIIYLTHSLSNRVSHGFPPGFSRLLMPGRLGS